MLVADAVVPEDEVEVEGFTFKLVVLSVAHFVDDHEVVVRRILRVDAEVARFPVERLNAELLDVDRFGALDVNRFVRGDHAEVFLSRRHLEVTAQVGEVHRAAVQIQVIDAGVDFSVSLGFLSSCNDSGILHRGGVRVL